MKICPKYTANKQKILIYFMPNCSLTLRNQTLFSPVFFLPNLEFIGMKTPQVFQMNFDSFNYARGVHYFFDLKTFPRAINSPSYALDLNNRFHSTYKSDQ